MSKAVCSRLDYASGVNSFIVQTTDDLELLPKMGICGKNNLKIILTTGFGSLATVLDTGDKYRLNDKNEWKKFSSASSGTGEGGESGGGSYEPGGDNDYVDEDDIDNLFPDTPTNPDTDSSVDDETLILSDSNGTVNDETWVIG